MRSGYLDIFTDGACSGNQFDENAGGWGCVLEYSGRIKEVHGGEINTTNNRMEIIALIEGLSKVTKPDFPVRVFTDSTYLADCLRKRWYERWRTNGWKNANKQPVENKDLWERLLAFLPVMDLRIYIIKGHMAPNAHKETLEKAYAKFREKNGDGFSYEEFMHIVEQNNRADALAVLGAEEARAQALAAGKARR
jgi:ribonuclease HI